MGGTAATAGRRVMADAMTGLAWVVLVTNGISVVALLGLAFWARFREGPGSNIAAATLGMFSFLSALLAVMVIFG